MPYINNQDRRNFWNPEKNERKNPGFMFRLLKIIFWIAVLAAVMVLGFAFFGDLSPNQETIEAPMSLDDA